MLEGAQRTRLAGPTLMEDELGRPTVGPAVEGDRRVDAFDRELVLRLAEEVEPGLARGLEEEAVLLLVTASSNDGVSA